MENTYQIGNGTLRVIGDNMETTMGEINSIQIALSRISTLDGGQTLTLACILGTQSKNATTARQAGISIMETLGGTNVNMVEVSNFIAHFPAHITVDVTK